MRRNYVDSKFLLATIGIWFLFMALAIINAAIRNEVYKPLVGDLAAHQISSVIFIVAILIVTYAILKFAKIELTDYDAFLMGAIWLISTILFEFLAGYYIFRNPWEKLLADYNLFEGKIWCLVLLTILLAPFVANRMR